MSGQQLITFLIVIGAGAYLGRNFVRSARAFFSNKGGCASGCGKCAFAQQYKEAKKKPYQNVIPLSAESPARKNPLL